MDSKPEEQTSPTHAVRAAAWVAPLPHLCACRRSRSAENKINKDNAWSSEYITVFGDIIKEQEEQGGAKHSDRPLPSEPQRPLRLPGPLPGGYCRFVLATSCAVPAGTLDFAAASSGVNAATIIWSYRVDSMYQTALQQLYQTKGVRGRHAQGALRAKHSF